MRNTERLEYFDRIKDPIWVEIPLTADEWRIIQTKCFARLRHIRQMGLAYLMFPGANHNRYEHSIGAMRAAHLLYQMLSEVPITTDQGIAIRSLRVAVLLHDIGHPPFSHAVEECFRKYPYLLTLSESKDKNVRELKKILPEPSQYGHENFSSYVVETNEEIREIIEGYDAEQIKNLAIGKAKGSKLGPLNSLIDGDFDADKIDYIIRDSYYCGLAHKIDLNEFRGKLKIEVQKGEKTFKLFVTPEGVSAIDSLLIARYKLIKEVHNHEINRIATQMLIEKIRLWLDGLTPAERAKMILEMHTDMTDYDLISILGEHKKGPSINDILDGRLYKGELSLPFSKMHPVIKASTHIVLNNPDFIANMQQQLREDLDNSNLLLDIREPRPPKFTTLVTFKTIKDGKEGSEARNIFDRYYTPHGILIDSFNDLAIHIYGPEEEKIEMSVKKRDALLKETETVPSFYFEYLEPIQDAIARRILLNSRKIRTEKSLENTVIDIDLLMIVLFAIERFGKEELFHRELWINSDSSLQSYLQGVIKFCNRKKLKIESAFVWDNNEFSTKVFRDLERLINMGLVDHAHKPVPHPANWGMRIDRRLSGWGKGYVGTEIKELHHEVQRYVYQTLCKVKKELLGPIIEKEKECALYDEASSIHKREPINEEIKKLKRRLREEKNIILTIG